MTQTITPNIKLESIITQLRDLLGSHLSTADSVLQQHGRGESWHPTQAPNAVCFAQTNEEVSAIIRLCAAAKVPVIAFGAGTSLEGHVQATQGGICIDLSAMNAVLDVNNDDLDCRVQWLIFPGRSRC
jgi:D-lactate dehydrogenase (cytochrome)